MNKTKANGHVDEPDVADAAPKKHGDKEWMASDKDAAAIPDNNMLVVMPCLMLVMFLAALDQTIVTTALPTIASHFNASREWSEVYRLPTVVDELTIPFGFSAGEYSWVGTSYLLVATIMVPCWGRGENLVRITPRQSQLTRAPSFLLVS